MQTFTNIKTGKQVTANFSVINGGTEVAKYYSLRNGEPFGPIRSMTQQRFLELHKEAGA